MLLVYEYLENGNLDKWLHKKVKSGSVRKVVLDWPWLKIAIGIAQGLSYMHHDCSPPVVHRHIKTSKHPFGYSIQCKSCWFWTR